MEDVAWWQYTPVQRKVMPWSHLRRPCSSYNSLKNCFFFLIFVFDFCFLLLSQWLSTRMGCPIAHVLGRSSRPLPIICSREDSILQWELRLGDTGRALFTQKSAYKKLCVSELLFFFLSSLSSQESLCGFPTLLGQ